MALQRLLFSSLCRCVLRGPMPAHSALPDLDAFIAGNKTTNEPPQHTLIHRVSAAHRMKVENNNYGLCSNKTSPRPPKPTPLSPGLTSSVWISFHLSPCVISCAICSKTHGPKPKSCAQAECSLAQLHPADCCVFYSRHRARTSR